MSVVANVAINVDARGAAQKLQDFQRKSEAAGKAADGLAKATQKAGATAAKSANQFSGASRSINSLIGTLGKLAAAYAGVRVAQSAIQAGIGRIESERRIQFLARSYGEIEQLASAAAASAAKFGESQTTANQALANAYARLRPVGVSLDDIVSTYNGFNTAARISGASSVEASNAFTQLAQALGSGALRGDEFNSIAEQVPGILTAISKEIGVAQGALRDYAADGKITADVVIRALKRIETEGANQLEEALNGPQQKIKDFQNASEDLAVAFSRELIPQMTDAVKALAKALRALEPILVGLGRVAAQVFTYIAGLANRIVDLSSGGRRAQAEIQASAEAQRVTRERFGLRVLSPEARQFRQQYERNILFNFDAQERERKRAAAALPSAGVTPTGAMPPAGTTGTTGTTSGGRRGTDKAAREAAQLQSRLRGLQIETQGTLQLALIKGKIAEAEMAGNKELAIRLQGEQRNQQILIDLQRSMKGVTDEREKQALLTKAQADLESAGMDTAAEMERLMQDRAKSVQDVISGLEFEQVKTLAVTDAQKQAIQFLEIENQLKSQGITLSDEQVAAIRRIIAETANLTKAQQEAQAKLQMEKDLYQGIADTVVGGFSSAIDAAVKGTENLGEALKGLGADLLQTIGKMLIMYGIAQALGALGGGAGNPQGIFSFLARGFGFEAAKDGAYWPGGFEAFADGGVVNRPTMGLIGEGGEPEYVIPASKMRGAMARYAGGARGAAVIPGNGESGAAAGSAPAGTIDVRYSIERINNVDYVTAEQFQRGMAEAAQQGAQQGETRALRRLQMSSSTRRKVGI